MKNKQIFMPRPCCSWDKLKTQRRQQLKKRIYRRWVAFWEHDTGAGLMLVLLFLIAAVKVIMFLSAYLDKILKVLS